jgi:hypothetical protein
VALKNDLWQLQSMSKPLDLKGFFATTELAGLGPGPRPGVESQAILEQQLKPLINQRPGLGRERQELIRALILLWHDHLEAAHEIAQGFDSVDGAFVHGIMHRREPDFGNAAYWFRRAGRHPAYVDIGAQATSILAAGAPKNLATRLLRSGEWVPLEFVDACAQASDESESFKGVLRELQKIEFCALLDSLAA